MSTNELSESSSPYLLQHAHNPVHWRMWSDAAFDEARRRDVPVLLSVGYSTCYWCHVMERESFESDATARVMNERFVCIKLDREEHPEIDEIYMAATTISTGSGGWPMNVFLEPERRRPFWCGTYFPPEPSHGRPSWTQVCEALSDAWEGKRDEVLDQARRLGEAVREQVERPGAVVEIGADQVGAAVRTLLSRFDQRHGGFGGAPKFPQPVFLELLLDARDAVDGPTRAAIDRCVRTTLDAMALGGIHDQIGGGFHRYSVDESWTMPHFEKMLYDNAQLLHTYARAASVYNDESWARVARRTAAFIRRELAPDPDGAGGFLSALDAEVDGREGKNYLWTPDEVRDALGADDAEYAIGAYGLSGEHNFRDPHHPDAPAAWVPRLSERPGDPERLDAINAKLLAVRDRRDGPRLDDKVIASWSAMTVSALARASAELDDSELLKVATGAARFVLGSMRTDAGDLARSRRGDSVGAAAGLEDHAALLCALMDLSERGESLDDEIDGLVRTIDARFSSAPGVYHDTDETRADLFVRPRTLHDGATPGGVGMLTLALTRRAAADGEDAWLDAACDALKGVSSAVASNPLGSANATRALLKMLRIADRVGDRFAFAAPNAGGSGDSGGGEQRGPIGVYVSEDRVELGASRPAASITVALDIPEPYHIVAADPGASETARALVPLRVGLVSGQGVGVYADYPQGAPLAQGDDEIMIVSGRVEFEVALEHAPGVGASPGAPMLGISYQACTHDRCAAPRTVRLGVEVVLGE